MAVLYSAISFLSALLLFMIQPMAAKSALPALGGAPFVWNGCMLFFQTLLLGGYLYAHLLNRFLPTKQQVFIHIPLLVMVLFYFPGGFFGSEQINPAYEPLRWLLTMLALSIGAPFFVMAATAPLAQRWLAAASPRHAENPYFLYAASNLGSFGALLAYPAIVEPNLALASQLGWIHMGFILLVFLFIAAAVNLCMHAPPEPLTGESGAIAEEEPTPMSLILRWLLLAAIPASLLYGVTLYITTDIASFPLFWIIPLSLYLLTFVLVFAKKPVGVKLCQLIHMPAVAAFLLFSLLYSGMGMWPMLAHLALFFIVSMSCHGHLADIRPHASRLTQFYLWMALGGVLGGAFNIFVAPEIFTSIVEYPLALILSMAAVIPLSTWRTASWKKEIALPLIVVGGVYSLCMIGLTHDQHLAGIFGKRESILGHTAEIDRTIWMAMIVAINIAIVFVVYLYERKKLVASLMTSVALYAGYHSVTLYFSAESEHLAQRNLLGVIRVTGGEQSKAFMLMHGTTTHGTQSTDPKLKLKLTSYYPPLAQIFEALDAKTAAHPIAGLGLGVGTAACTSKRAKKIDFFEINPLVESIAQDDRYFTYLRDCPAKATVHISDARIGLSGMPDGYYSLIIADTFSSDAIPIHMLTLEASAMYLRKITEDGGVAYNISNRYLDLAPVLSAIAGELGVKAYQLDYRPKAELEYASVWVVLTKSEKFGKNLLAKNKDWRPLPPTDKHYLWRDDYSNIVKVMDW